ncbi:MAG: hypothetical protein HQK81_06370 [Desulfovibrionaceae bacterium]|nr:hypothetical protein [Desulfovibrionaceae bacterium]MBF0513674.1 hypothetical protein [Desulfovibrionaceae bacterium]
MSRRQHKRDNVHISVSAKFIASIVAILLSLPVVLIGLQGRGDLESFHNRILNEWPRFPLWEDPKKYFADAKLWIDDRVYPIIQLSVFRTELLLNVFDRPPQKRITIGKNGFIFLNGGTESTVFSIFEEVCINSHRESVAADLRDALATLQAYSKRSGIIFDVVMVPTLPTVYGDYLPESVPEKIRGACRERAAGRSPLIELSRNSAGRFCYPLLEMNAARGDEAFFPKANFHAYGMSMKVVRDAYLSARGLAIPTHERLEPGRFPAEILTMYRIVKNIPAYRFGNDAIHEYKGAAMVFAKRIKDLFRAPKIDTRILSCSTAPNGETVFMLSDSFGTNASEVFAGAFRRLLQATSNNMPDSQAPILLDRVKKMEHIDRVILLVEESNAGRIIDWARAFGDSAD